MDKITFSLIITGSIYFVIFGIWASAPDACYHEIDKILVLSDDESKDCWKQETPIWFIYLGIAELVFCMLVILTKKMQILKKK